MPDMTDRDHFAAAALTGLISLNCPGPNQQFPQELCERAYRWADAMLRCRGTGDTPATHATRGECSEPREGTEPVAWAVMLADGERIYDVYALEEDAKAIDEAVIGNHGVVPLYRNPPCQDSSQKNLTLTDAEREAIEFALDRLRGTLRGNEECDHAATLRGLLERLGGGR